MYVNIPEEIDIEEEMSGLEDKIDNSSSLKDVV
jgi:hypothetical protein